MYTGAGIAELQIFYFTQNLKKHREKTFIGGFRKKRGDAP